MPRSFFIPLRHIIAGDSMELKLFKRLNPFESVKIKRKGGKITELRIGKEHLTPVAREHYNTLSNAAYEGVQFGPDLPLPPLPGGINHEELEKKTERMSSLIKNDGASALISDLSPITPEERDKLDSALKSGKLVFSVRLGRMVINWR